MKMSITPSALSDYVCGQLNAHFPDKKKVKQEAIRKSLGRVMERAEHCFSKIKNKYFCAAGGPVFNHLNADHYAMFLYWTANTLYQKNADPSLCSKLFLLNRSLHGVDAFYEVKLPDIFLFVHPMATMIGRAEYSDYFVVYQQCTIGSSKGVYPRLGKFTSLHPGSAVIGNCSVGDNCKISAGSILLDQNLEDDSVYVGTTLRHLIKKSAKRLPIWVTENPVKENSKCLKK